MDDTQPPTTPGDGAAEGERRKARGVKRAADGEKSGGRTAELQRRVLVLALAGRRFTIDDLSTADELAGNLGGNAPHRGAALVGCARRKLIRQTGERRKSTRPHRHAGTNPVWEAAVPAAEIAAALAELPAPPSAAGPRPPRAPSAQPPLPFGEE